MKGVAHGSITTYFVEGPKKEGTIEFKQEMGIAGAKSASHKAKSKTVSRGAPPKKPAAKSASAKSTDVRHSGRSQTPVKAFSFLKDGLSDKVRRNSMPGAEKEKPPKSPASEKSKASERASDAVKVAVPASPGRGRPRKDITETPKSQSKPDKTKDVTKPKSPAPSKSPIAKAKKQKPRSAEAKAPKFPEVKELRMRPSVNYLLLSGRLRGYEDFTLPYEPPASPVVRKAVAPPPTKKAPSPKADRAPKRPREEEEPVKTAKLPKPAAKPAKPAKKPPPPPAKRARTTAAAVVAAPPPAPAPAAKKETGGRARHSRAQLEGMAVVEVLAIMTAVGVSASGCMDKDEMIDALLRAK
jgi:hypothetical protein